MFLMIVLPRTAEKLYHSLQAVARWPHLEVLKSNEFFVCLDAFLSHKIELIGKSDLFPICNVAEFRIVLYKGIIH